MDYRIALCLKSTAKYNLLRALRPSFNVFRLSYSTNDLKVSEPIKFSSNPASKTTIVENLNIKPLPTDKPLIHRLSVVGSIAALLLYFCVLREENDLDEMLKGDLNYSSEHESYIRLKLMKEYCEKNKLPTQMVKQKLSEVEKKLGVSSD